MTCSKAIDDHLFFSLNILYYLPLTGSSLHLVELLLRFNPLDVPLLHYFLLQYGKPISVINCYQFWWSEISLCRCYVNLLVLRNTTVVHRFNNWVVIQYTTNPPPPPPFLPLANIMIEVSSEISWVTGAEVTLGFPCGQVAQSLFYLAAAVTDGAL